MPGRVRTAPTPSGSRAGPRGSGASVRHCRRDHKRRVRSARRASGPASLCRREGSAGRRPRTRRARTAASLSIAACPFWATSRMLLPSASAVTRMSSVPGTRRRASIRYAWTCRRRRFPEARPFAHHCASRRRPRDRPGRRAIPRQSRPRTIAARSAMRCSPRAFGWTGTMFCPNRSGSIQRLPVGWHASWPADAWAKST